MSTSASFDYEALQRLVTPERLTSYLRSTDGDIRQAFALYDWNIEASASVLSMAAMVEVVLRNALDRQMTAWARTRGLADWLDAPPLDPRGLADVSQAFSRASRGRRRPMTHGHVVAELNLGFWRYLASRKYLTTLWVVHLSEAFPHLDRDPQSKRVQIESDAQQLLFLRNRAAHHEPIHRRNLTADLGQALHLVAAIDPVAEQWVRARERITEVIAQRPIR